MLSYLPFDCFFLISLCSLFLSFLYSSVVCLFLKLCYLSSSILFTISFVSLFYIFHLIFPLCSFPRIIFPVHFLNQSPWFVLSRAHFSDNCSYNCLFINFMITLLASLTSSIQKSCPIIRSLSLSLIWFTVACICKLSLCFLFSSSNHRNKFEIYKSSMVGCIANRTFWECYYCFV